MKKKWLAGMMILIMAVSLLSGCGKTEDDKKTQGSTNEGNQEEQQDSQNGKDTGGKENTGDENNTPVAMGRYAEKKIDFPKEVMDRGEKLLSVLQSPENEIVLFSGKVTEDKKGSIQKYVLQQDGSWKQLEEEWLKDDFGETAAYDSFSYGQDGNLYMVQYWDYVDTNRPTELYMLNRDTGKLEKIALELGSNEAGEIRVAQNGNIVVMAAYSPSTIKIYNASGKKLTEFTEGSARIEIFKDELLFVNSDANAVSILNSETGLSEKDYAIETPSDKMNVSYAVCKDEENIYMADRKGLHRIAENGSKWETLLDGDMCSLSSPTYQLLRLYKAEEKKYYVLCGNKNSELELLQIDYREDLASTSSEVLTVFSLEEYDSIRQAIVEFHRDYPEVKVDYRVMLGENSAVTKEDAIKSLNTELLNGQGADILVLDSLPFESYMEQGLLTDLTGVINELVNDGSLLSNIAETVKASDGKYYYMPVKLFLPLMIGNSEELTAAETMAGLSQSAASGKKPILFGSQDAAGIIKLLYKMFGDEIIQGDTVNEAKLSEFIQTAAAITDAFKDRNGEAYTYDVGRDMAIIMGTSRLEYFELAKLTDFMSTAAIVDSYDANIAVPGGGFIPKAMVGVNSNTKQSELASAFIRTLFGSSLQSTDLDGFPVNPEGIKAWNKTNMNIIMSTSDEDGNHFEMEWPSEEKITALTANISKLDRLILLDDNILAMMQEEFEAVANGNRNAGEASSNLAQRLKAYLNE